MKLAVGLLALAAHAQDSIHTLSQARDKLLAESRDLPRFACVETIDRSYYSRPAGGTPTSCENLALARKNGKSHLRLDRADRLRLRVTIAGGHEIYSWTGAAPSAHKVEEILDTGPIGTGAFAGHLLEVFQNPQVRFRVLREGAEMLEYGFRMPMEASRYLAASPNGWLPAGYSGSVRIDAGSLDIRHFEVVSDELPPETGICQQGTVLDFRKRKDSANDWLIPTASRTHDIEVDASETESVILFSDCREHAVEPEPAAPKGALLAPGQRLTVAFDRAIDAATAAAGDEISATVKSPANLAGATLSGRLVAVIRREPEEQLFVSVAFDMLVDHGAASPFYAKLIKPQPAVESTGPVRMPGPGVKEWPHGMMVFRTGRPQTYVVPGGFRSTWETIPMPY